MSRRSMRSAAAVLVVVFVQLATVGSPLAQSAVRHNSSRGTSTTKRVVWSLIGAGAGFGLGAMFGLHKFDDATNSDRKVTISAITGAMVGGLAGGFLSRETSPSFVPRRPKPLGATEVMPRLRPRPDDALVARIRAASAREFELR